MKISLPEDCGNAPRKRFIADFNIAFANGDMEFLTNCFAENAVWEMVGDKTIEGLENIISSLKEMADYRAESLELKSVITHGKLAAAEGTLSFGEENTIAFCDTYEFTSAGKNKIKRLNSYIVELNKSKS